MSLTLLVSIAICPVSIAICLVAMGWSIALLHRVLDWRRRFLTISHDATEIKQSEEALRNSEERYRQFISSNYIGIWCAEYRESIPVSLPVEEQLERMYEGAFFAECNDAFARMYGFNGGAEMIGLSMAEGFRLSQRDTKRALRTYIESGYRAIDGEVHSVNASGQGRDFLYSTFGTVEDGYLTRSWGTQIDITERKRTERKLRDSEKQYRELFEEVNAARQRLEHLSRRLVKVQEQERRHIAMELHDEIGQLLTSLRMSLELTAMSVPSSERLEHAMDLTDTLMTKVRALSLDLRPSMLDDLGLLSTLLWYVQRYTSQTNIQVDLQQSGLLKQRFPSEVETTAYRIVQEALTNVARHAGVDHATVRLRHQEDTLRLTIEDKGSGFDTVSALRMHETGGLSGIMERAGLVGGDISVEASPGKGTRLCAIFPISTPIRMRETRR